ncbi:MAG: hypothetical protein IPL23_02810 [Saprospiraceae bacterium]|nr:hypothetical protein [Saprospiraceae bacterium]
MYFASDYHLGLGGFDLFEARKINGPFRQINQVNGVNSSMEETYSIHHQSYRRLIFYFK